jgi:hypothetical protein
VEEEASQEASAHLSEEDKLEVEDDSPEIIKDREDISTSDNSFILFTP